MFIIIISGTSYLSPTLASSTPAYNFGSMSQVHSTAMEIAGFCNEMIMSVKSWGWNIRLGRYGPGLRFNVLAAAWSIGSSFSKPHHCCHAHGQFGGGINQAGLIVSPAGHKGDILTVVQWY